ncbi:MAG: recombinase family protein [Planctomycetia bacterium]|nr:recombinase family protein [Planctomycetia bacterium]
MRRPSDEDAAKKPVRCGIYTRKSTEEGLDSGFSSLDAQREACEAFVKSQQHEGWRAVPERFDDGGFTGANTDRPALRRLLDQVDAGRIDCIVTYKLDRLSRSIRDFAELMANFEEKGITYVSVTQQINTATAAGRLLQNVLVTFAQFEREVISERTRDKIRMSKQKGKWLGGCPPIGYDRAKEGCALVVNEVEAARVREMFTLYLRERSLLRVAQIANARGWRSKTWTTKAGVTIAGREFTKTSLQQLLVNVVYAGRIAHRGQTFKGEHSPIVDEKTFAAAQRVLEDGRRRPVGRGPNENAYLLGGLVRCAACGSAMTAGTTTKGAVKYRYYVCVRAKKLGVDACPVRSVPAPELEAFVVDRIRALGRDPELVAEVIERARKTQQEGIPPLRAEERAISVELQKLKHEAARLVAALAGPGDGSATASGKLADVERRVEQLKARQAEIRDKIAALSKATVDEADARAALELFDPVWQHLTLEEKTRLVRTVVERVEFDGVKNEIELHFHPLGLASLAEELKSAPEPPAPLKGATA